MSNIKVKGYRLKRKKRNFFVNRLIELLWIIFLLFLLIIGISLIFGSIYYMDDIAALVPDYTYVIGFGIAAIFYFFLAASHFTNSLIRLALTFIVFIMAGALVQFLGVYLLKVVQYVTAISVIIIGILITINWFRKLRDGVGFIRSFPTFLLAYLYINIGISIILDYDGFFMLTFFIGIYLTLLQLNVLWQLFTARTRLDRIRKVKKIITFPTIFSSFLTIGFFKQIENKANRTDHLQEVENRGEDAMVANRTTNSIEYYKEKPDLTIFIHIRKGLLEGVGHVDIEFDNKVYCYGEYDHDAKHFGGLFWDGVLAVMEPDEHIKRAVREEEKLLIAYELKLTKRQKEKVRKKIDQIMSKSYRWRSKAELAADHLLEGSPKDYTDPASNLYNFSKAETYKFSKGSNYKTYYLLGQNCSIVANDIIEQIGIKLRKINGIITPGAYLNFMEELRQMPHSVVSDRIIYRGEVIPDNEIEIDDSIA